MRTWRDTPFQSKVTLAIFLISCCVMFVAFAALLAFQLFTLQRNFERDLGSIARIMATSCSGAVAFNDEAAASAILASLQERQFFNRAWIETPGNDLFANIETNQARDPRNKVKPLGQSGALALLQPWKSRQTIPFASLSSRTIPLSAKASSNGLTMNRR